MKRLFLALLFTATVFTPVSCNKEEKPPLIDPIERVEWYVKYIRSDNTINQAGVWRV